MLALSFLSSGAWAQRSWVIENARIEIGNGQVIARGSIAVRDGRITAVGETVDGTGLMQIDGTGLTITPGFIDAFSRQGLKSPESAANPTQPVYREDPPINFWRENRRGVSAQLDASQLIDDSDFDASYFANGFTTIHAASGRGGFGGWSAVFDLDKDANRLLKAKAFQTLTSSFGGGAGYPGTGLGRFALLRQILFSAKDPGEDKDLLALQPAVSGASSILCLANSDRDIYRMLNLAKETGFGPAILGGREAWKFAGELKSVPVILALESISPPSRTSSETPKSLLEERYATWEQEAPFLKKFAETGLSFAISVDGQRDDFLKIIRQHITWGLKRETALRALTLDAATLLGLAQETGTIEVGKRANLAAFTGDFAQEGTVVKFVLVSGEKKEISK